MNNPLKNNLRLILILTSLSTGIMSFFLPIYSKALNMDALEISGLFSLTAFILIILRPFIGKLIDKVGRKPTLAMAVFIYAIAYLTFSMATTSALLYTARALQGIASAFMGISIYAIVADTHNSNNISKGFGKVNSAQSTGNIYGCILAFIVLYRVSFLDGWRILFLIFALAALFALFKVITTFKESKSAYMHKRINLKNYSKSTLKLLTIVFITSLSSAMMSPIIMIYLQDKITTDIGGLGLAFFPSLLIASLLSEKIGTISDKLGKSKSMILGMIICGCTFIILPNLSSVIMFTVIWTLSSLGGILYDLSESGLYTQLNTKNDNGEIFGIYTLVCDLGRMIGPLVGGALYNSLSQKSPFYLHGTIMLFVAVLIPILLKNTIKLSE